jgi:hypothetical protein
MKKPHFRIELIQDEDGFWNVKVWDENEKWVYSQIVDFGDDLKAVARDAGITFVQRADGAATYTFEEHFYQKASPAQSRK